MRVAKQKKPTTKTRKVPATVHATVFVAIGLLLLFTAPYLGAVLFSALIAFIFYPVYGWLHKKSGSEGLSLLGTLTTVFMAAILPITILSLVTITQVNALIDDLSNGEITVGAANIQEVVDRGIERVNRTLESLPGGEKLHIDENSVTSALKDLGVSLLNGLAEFIKDAGTAIFGLISTFILAIFLIIAMLKYQLSIISFIKAISPFDDSINNLYLQQAAAMTKAMVKGQFVIASIQGFLSALSLWIIGIDYFWFFMTLLIFLSFIPLGGGILTIPIGLVMILTGNWVQGIFVILFHVLVVTNIDNILRPRLVPKAARLNSALLLLAVFSGIAVFGAAGVIFGPVAMILLISSLEIYAQYNHDRVRPKLLTKSPPQK